MVIRFLLCWSFSWLLLSVQGQALRILDAEDGLGVAFASASAITQRWYAMSDLEGWVDLRGLSPSDSLVLSCLGYRTVRLSLHDLAALSYIVPLEQDTRALEEIVVAASRWRQHAGRQAAQVLQISSEEKALLNPQTAADLLAISGKVYVQKSQQGGGSPMIRGFAANRLLYAVDGVRLNTAIFRSGNLQNVINLDPFVQESVEVVLGPGSVMYGSDAIGGVMSFQSLAASLRKAGEANLTGKVLLRHATANQEKTGHLQLQFHGKRWASVSSVSHWDFGHLRQGKRGPDDYLKPFYVARINGRDSIVQQSQPLLQIPSAYSQLNVLQKIRFQASRYWDFTYAFHYSSTSTFGRYDRHNRLRNGLARYGQWDYGPQNWQMNVLQVAHKRKTLLQDEAILRIAQQKFEESRVSRDFNRSLLEQTAERVLAYSINLDVRKKLNSRQNLYYGMEAILNQVGSSGFALHIDDQSKSPSAARYPLSDWYSLAAFATTDWQISSKSLLQGGLRYSYFGLQTDFSNNALFFPFDFQESQLNQGGLTGSFGWVFRPSDTWIIKTNMGSAFRAPNVDDIGKIFDSEPGRVTVPNPNLRPEYAYHLDIGFAKLIGINLKVEIGGYYTYLNQALVRRNYQLNGLDSLVYQGQLSQIQAIQNAAQANVYGLNSSLEWHIASGLQFSTDLNWQAGREELDDGRSSPARHVAPFFGRARLQYVHKGIRCQLYTDFQASRSFLQLAEEERSKTEIYAKDADGNNYAPGWIALHLKTSYRISSKLEIQAGLENITDQRYRPYSSGISAAGRNGVLAVQLGF